MRSRTDDSDDPAGPVPVLRRWLARELFWAVSSSALDVAAVRDILDKGTLSAALTTMTRRIFPKEQVDEIRASFSEGFRTSLVADLSGAVEQPRVFRRQLALILSAGGDQKDGLLDDPVREDVDLYIKIVQTFVSVDRWSGGGDESFELTFDGKMFDRVFSADCRQRFAARLGVQPTPAEIDLEDTSPENQKAFALAMAVHEPSL